MTGPARRHLPATVPTWEREADVVVVGSGAAGMSAALEAAASGLRVLLVGKDGIGGGSTPWAQGGLAAALDPDDSADSHVDDTLRAGAGICDPEAVALLVGAAPGEIARLRGLGARFDAGPLGLEGGHSHRRIVHAGGDASGAEVHRVLARALAASAVEVVAPAVALDLLVEPGGAVAGLLVGAVGPGGPAAPLAVGVLRAAAVVLASGGYGQAYATTTNPAGVTGDGLAMAARAGVELSDVEFVQFHPTVLFEPGRRGQRPLITEALRGAGAVIVDGTGAPVMAGVHPLADLAPRDVVAAAMHRAMHRGGGGSHLWLDATGVGAARLRTSFPTVVAICAEAGIDPATEPIPVAPGAHYACGGIRADMDGATSLPGLYAVGEAAATGVHGANRLASNSLTEALVTGRRIGARLGAVPPGRPGRGAPPAPGPGVAARARAGHAEAMARHAGVVRHQEGLEHLLGILADAPAADPGAGLDLATVEATNLHTVSVMVATAALLRTESRGCHQRADAPGARDEWLRRIALRDADGELAARVGATT